MAVTVDLDELRRDAAAFVSRAEQGEEFVITTVGQPRARLVPASRDQWRAFADVAELFNGPADTACAADRGLIDDELRDP